ncbi:IS630 family transposase [Candidatus Parcubacteria bacterium]|nr:IS630 family transposase [Candidatus Parcubacteria bacterium]
MSYKKPCLTPGNHPEEKIQKKFIQSYRYYLKKAKNKEIHLLFSDPTHLVHNTIKSKCWQSKGAKGTIQLSSNTGRKRLNIIGSIDVIEKKFSGVITESNCNREAIKTELNIIRENYPDNKKIVVFMDNARYQKSYEVKKYARKKNIYLRFIPPYSPNLNLIERLWKFVKKKLRNKYRKEFKDFESAIVDICRDIKNKYLDEVSRLINHKFQILK